MRNPAVLTPEQRIGCEAILKPVLKDYAARSLFFLALVSCETDRFAEALKGFTGLVQKYPDSPLAAEAALRQGFCRMQLHNYAEAVKLLQPLHNHPQLADRALWWTARCHIAAADRKDAQTYKTTLQSAQNLLRRAADLAGQLGQTQPRANARRGEILIELADTMQLAGQHREAAEVYQWILQENNNPDRTEEILQRRITALHLAGMYAESEQQAAVFEQNYPKSPLLAAVWFRRAENSYQMALAAAANPNLPNREAETNRLLGEAIARYRRLIAKYPAFEYINHAREGAAAASYRLGRCTDAIALLGAISIEARSGELAAVSYLLGDCHLRCAPTQPNNALVAGELISRCEQAAALFESFLSANEKSPQAADALFKLGYCGTRIAQLVTDTEERKKALSRARSAYDRLLQQFPQDPLVPDAVLARAECILAQGDPGGALNELGRFQLDPLRQASVAPLALMRQAALLRIQNRAQDAANVLQQCRATYEAALLKDSLRADWVPVLLHDHGLSLMLAGKLTEARAVFEELIRKFPDVLAALSAVWRVAQCQRLELKNRLAAALPVLRRLDAPAQDTEAARKSVEESMAALRSAVGRVELWHAAITHGSANPEAGLWLLYEAAWGHRVLDEAEQDLQAHRWRTESAARIKARSAPSPPAQLSVAFLPPSQEIVPGPDEIAARRCYELIITGAPQTPLAARVAAELSDLLIRRGEYEAARKQIQEALNGRPTRETLDALQLRLAAVCLAQDDPSTALRQAEGVLIRTGSKTDPCALYLAGEALARQRNWAKAIERLLPFRDQPAFQNLTDLSDRALLRLGQAYLERGDLGGCRQTLQTLLHRFAQSPWVDQALYTIGFSLQKEKQFDQAVEAYTQLTRRSVTEWAARAQYQIGICRREQKKLAEAVQAFLSVPLTYDHVEWHPPALFEAARSYRELKQNERAMELWRRIVQDYPLTPWARAAGEEMSKLQFAPPTAR